MSEPEPVLFTDQELGSGPPGAEPLKAPFPWFGGKSRVAPIVWDHFGNVPNYVEPFAGSLAVLLGRPGATGLETVNDKDAYLVNFWRAIQADPEATAKWADWPVSEADLIARHRWLTQTAASRLEALKTQPEYFDVMLAGWWVWGQCSWIGEGWCHATTANQHMPCMNSGMGVNRHLPHLGDAGMGINRKLPHLAGGRGVNRKFPHLGSAEKIAKLTAYFAALAARLRDVRICCGEWDRILGESVTVKNGTTGLFLDPPYSEGEHTVQYNTGSSNPAPAVRQWAIDNGDNPELRIALCGYEGEHQIPGSWECFAWKAQGGYGSQGKGRGRENSNRERIWFSPHCLRPQESLFYCGDNDEWSYQ